MALPEPLPPVDLLISRLADAGIDVPPGRVRVERYGDSPALSGELIEHIRSGPKRAGTSLLWGIEHDGDDMPAIGDIEIVIDHLEEPLLLTRLTRVDVKPFCNVDTEYAAIEGEGDGLLECWR